MRRYLLIPLLLAAMPAHAGFIPEAQRASLVTLVLQKFWGNARYSNGSVIQPASEQERTTVPVPGAITQRVIDAGEISGLGEWCKLEWTPNLLALTKAARSTGLNEKQVAFISVLHGSAQARIERTMSSDHACSSAEREKIEQMLKRSQTTPL